MRQPLVASTHCARPSLPPPAGVAAAAGGWCALRCRPSLPRPGANAVAMRKRLDSSLAMLHSPSPTGSGGVACRNRAGPAQARSSSRACGHRSRAARRLGAWTASTHGGRCLNPLAVRLDWMEATAPTRETARWEAQPARAQASTSPTWAASLTQPHAARRGCSSSGSGGSARCARCGRTCGLAGAAPAPHAGAPPP